MDVVIVGGSLTGLMYGIVLNDLGHRVNILERSHETLLAQAGAGLQVSEDVEKLMHEYQCDLEPYFITNPEALYVDHAGKLITKLPGVRATSWDTIYQRLRASFDGFRTQFYNHANESRNGSATYSHACTVENITVSGGKASVEYRALEGSKHCYADLVIVADGSGSHMHKVLRTGSARGHAGYVALRGTLSAAQVAEVAEDDLGRHCQIPQSFFLSYLIPGEDGSLHPRSCRRNWVWYRRLLADSDDFRALMSDVHGICHTNSLPRGGMRPEMWEQQKKHAKELLDERCAKHLEMTDQPFVQAIAPLSTPSAVYHDGKVLLVGDAFATLRPLSGLGTNQGAKGAMGLRRVLQGQMSLEAWDTMCIESARSAQEFSLARERQAQLSG